MSQLADLRWMLPPLAMCLVLTGIHGYLGIHVLSRKVIFVDLALAQIAALGSTYALLLGYDPRLPRDGVVVYLFSLGFTVAAAALFSLTRMRHEKVPQEAIIGTVYATASALSLLMLAKAGGESEHIKEMLVGNVLLVTWPAVGSTALIYTAVGAFHWLFRKPFLEISLDPEAAHAGGRRLRLWDFLFYASFGFVITSSVAVAGVLLVFSFLVVPAIVAFLYQERTGARIVLAWAVGIVCSTAGMCLSYYGDLPTGPSVVACFAIVLGLAAAAYFVRGAERRLRAGGQLVAAALVACAFFALTPSARKPRVDAAPTDNLEKLLTALEHGDESAQVDAVHHLAELHDPRAVPSLVRSLTNATSDRLTEHVVQALAEFGDAARPAIPPLMNVATRGDDPFLRLEAITTLLRLHDPSGFEALVPFLVHDPPLLLEQRAGELLREVTGDDFGVGLSADAADRARARQRLHAWLTARGMRLRWRPDLRRFD